MIPVPPANIIDIGTTDDAGFWLDALPFVHFPVEDSKPANHTGHRRADDFTGPVSLSHTPEVTQP